MTSATRDWAALPEHILDLIVKKFTRLSEHFYFSAVCSNWRKLSPSLSNYLDTINLFRKKIPMLMFKTEKHNDDSRGLYNVLNKVSFDIRLPIPYDFRFVGSSHGWLFCLDRRMVITLLDPFNSDRITLPIFKDVSGIALRCKWHSVDLLDHYIQKAILTSDPRTSPNNYEVVVIFHPSLLAYYKSGDQYWTFINLRPVKRYVHCDVIYHKGCIYSVTYHGELLQIDFHNGKANTIVPEKPEGGEPHGFYLVESKEEELLLVKRVWYIEERDDGTDFDKTTKFEVFKVMHVTNEDLAAWHEINDIGDQALFVGCSNRSECVSTLECLNFHRNSIYYTPHAYLDSPTKFMVLETEIDCGIFNLEDKSFHKLLGLLGNHVRPPVWFLPNLN